MRPHVSTAVWAFVDLLFNVLLVTLYINSLMDIPRPKASEAKREGITPGKLCAELYWPDNLDIDLDLWGRGPSGSIVGYSNRSSIDLDLLRDTLGKYSNPGGHNFEMMCSTALLPGQWTFNVHYYKPHEAPVPLNIPVKLVVNFPQDQRSGGLTDTPREHLEYATILPGVGDEITLMDFELGKDGRVIAGSVNHLNEPLRSKGAGN